MNPEDMLSLPRKENIMDPQFLANTLLFRGIDPEDIRAMASCLGFREAPSI